MVDGFVNQAMVALLVVALVAVVAFTVYTGVNPDLAPLRWAQDHPEQAEYYEERCNEQFGYEWEFRPSDSVMSPSGDEVEITCAMDTGFLSGTHEHITVPVAGS